MKKTSLLVLLLFSFALISGCAANLNNLPEIPVEKEMIKESYTPEQPQENLVDDSVYQKKQEPEVKVIDFQYPKITTSVSPSNPSLGGTFTLTISAEVDQGLTYLSWKSPKPFSNYGEKGFFDCNLEKKCSHSWELIAMEEGLHQLTITVVDSSGRESGTAPVEVNVAPFRARANTTVNKIPTQNIQAENTTKSTVADDSCTSNSDCGYKQICTNKQCTSVQCTNDGQCSGCRRCSGNRCVSCGYGSAGYCTC